MKKKKKAKKQAATRKIVMIPNLEARERVLFTRISPSARSFVTSEASRKGVSEAAFVDYVLTWFQHNGQFLEDVC